MPYLFAGLIALFLLAYLTSVHSAEFSKPNDNGIVHMTGEIHRGDAEKLVKIFTTTPAITALVLNSPGGDLLEALKISRLVHEGQIAVLVLSPGICASACFFIFIEGASRLAVGSDSLPITKLGKVGLHRPYFPNPSASEKHLQQQFELMSKVKSYLDRKLIPSRLTDLMMSRPSNNIYWLTQDDLEMIGEFTPELEELYIAKCGYNRTAIAEHANAKLRGDFLQAKRLDEEITSATSCIGRIQINSYFDFVNKLRKGWRPKIVI